MTLEQAVQQAEAIVTAKLGEFDSLTSATTP
jgi:hypothetical protein